MKIEKMTATELERIRKELKLSRKGLAVMLGMGEGLYSTVARWERGELAVPQPNAILLRLSLRFRQVRDYLQIADLQEQYPDRPRGRPVPARAA